MKDIEDFIEKDGDIAIKDKIGATVVSELGSFRLRCFLPCNIVIFETSLIGETNENSNVSPLHDLAY